MSQRVLAFLTDWNSSYINKVAKIKISYTAKQGSFAAFNDFWILGELFSSFHNSYREVYC